MTRTLSKLDAKVFQHGASSIEIDERAGFQFWCGLWGHNVAYPWPPKPVNTKSPLPSKMHAPVQSLKTCGATLLQIWTCGQIVIRKRSQSKVSVTSRKHQKPPQNLRDVGSPRFADLSGGWTSRSSAFQDPTVSQSTTCNFTPEALYARRICREDTKEQQ